jgi:hypothetical protein
MNGEMNGTVSSFSALLASSAETLYRLQHGLTFDRDPTQPIIPAATDTAELLDSLRPAVLFIGRTLQGSSIPDVCPAPAAGKLLQAVRELSLAVRHIDKASKALSIGNQQSRRPREIPSPVTPQHPGSARPAKQAKAPVAPGDINSTVKSLSALVASASESLYMVQHGLHERGPGQPITNVLAARDLLGKLRLGLTHIGRVLGICTNPSICPAAALPDVRHAVDMIERAARTINKAGKALDTGSQQGRRPLEFPDAVTPDATASGSTSRRALGPASRTAARRRP